MEGNKRQAKQQEEDEEEELLVLPTSTRAKSPSGSTAQNDAGNDDRDDAKEDSKTGPIPSPTSPTSAAGRKKSQQDGSRRRSTMSTTTSTSIPTRPYQNELHKPVQTTDGRTLIVGGRHLSYAEAKLFGLVDPYSGEFNEDHPAVSPKKKKSIAATYKQEMVKVQKLSEAKELDLQHVIDGIEAEKELTFKPVKSEAAKRAMLNPRLGYDFIRSLNDDHQDFLARYSAEPKQGSKAEKKRLQGPKEDYDAKLDKLACPTCKATQSFDEYHNRVRSCRKCNQKFVQLNVCNMNTFARAMREKEQQASERLKKLDDEVYGSLGKLPEKAIHPSRLRRLREEAADRRALASALEASPDPRGSSSKPSYEDDETDPPEQLLRGGDGRPHAVTAPLGRKGSGQRFEGGDTRETTVDRKQNKTATVAEKFSKLVR